MPNQSVSLKVAISGTAGFTAAVSQDVSPDTMTRSSFDLAQKGDAKAKKEAPLPAAGNVTALLITAYNAKGAAAEVTVTPKNANPAVPPVKVNGALLIVNEAVLAATLGNSRELEIANEAGEVTSVLVLGCV